MAPPQRIRFNAKARGSTAGGKSKSSKSKRGQVAGANSELDANAEMLGRKSEVDKEDDRREKLRLEVCKMFENEELETYAVDCVEACQ